LQVAAVKAPASAIVARQCCRTSLPSPAQGHHRRSGHQLENVQISDLGQAKKITIDKDNTTIVEGKGKPGDVSGRVKEIRGQIDKTTSDYDREKFAGAVGEAGRRRSRNQRSAPPPKPK